MNFSCQINEMRFILNNKHTRAADVDRKTIILSRPLIVKKKK